MKIIKPGKTSTFLNCYRIIMEVLPRKRIVRLLNTSQQSHLVRIRYTAIKANCLVAVVLFALPVVVQAQFIYATNGDNTVTVTGCSGYLSGSVTVPDSFFTNGMDMPVTGIGYHAFLLQTITGVTMGTNLTSIGIEAFEDCYNLQSVTIGPNVNSIGNGAFFYCTKLGNITIPGSVTFMGVNVFWDCTSLSSVSILDGLTNIPNNTFFDCSSLSSITIPDSVISIGPGAFGQCTALSSISIPSSVISLVDGLFAGCTSLAAITVDANNPAYSSVDGVLFNKNQTTLIQYPTAKTGTFYTIPNTVTSIATEAFYGCTGPTSVKIPMLSPASERPHSMPAPA